MVWSIHDTNRFAKRMAEVGREYTPPTIPDLPSDQAAFIISDGEPDEDLLMAITSLHEILNHDGQELREAYDGRTRAAEERRRLMETNPPQPKDIILNYWRIEKPAAQEEGPSK